MTTAAMRAAHFLADRPLVFADPFALELTSDEYRALHESIGLPAHFGGPRIRLVQGHVVGRARWAEDRLEAALAEGIDQYVMIAAGLDSFALRRRDLLPRLRVLELDRPALQAHKRARLARLGRDLPEGVEMRALDLRAESLARVLRSSSFAPARPAFFAALGIVSYLERAALLAMLDALRASCAPGSRIVFDYPIPPHLMSEDDRALAEEVSRVTAAHGETRRGKHVPEELHRDLEARGFALVEDVSPHEMARRYFAGRNDGLAPYPESHLACFRVER
jgi:methyltransferase (TIGR00027 family)